MRWALALMLDARAMSMASYRGAATLSAISIPPTGTHPDDYHIPMQEELINFELDTGERVIKPYNPNIGLEIADMVRPEFGDEVPDRRGRDPPVLRLRVVEPGPRRGGCAAAQRRFHRGRRWMDDAQRRAVRVHAEHRVRGRRDEPAGHDRRPDVDARPACP